MQEQVSHEKLRVWYNAKHEKGGKDAWRPFEAYSIILNYLKVREGQSLLDVGCGTGYLLKAADMQGLKTAGVDISDKAVSIAKQVTPNTEFKIGPGEVLDFPDNSFDYVTCLGSLEHFADVAKALDEMRRVAKSDAKFCIIVPNINFIYWKLKKTKGTEQQAINERLWSLKQWRECFEENGFEIKQVYQDDWHKRKLKILESLNPIKVAKTAGLKLAWEVLPLKYTYQFVFVMQNKF